VHTLDPPELQITGWITHFQFDDAALYDTISYTYTNADTDGSRARFMGLIVDGGGLQTDTAILTVNVNGANDAVTANDDGGEITEMLGPETPASTVVGTVVGNPHGGGTNSPNAGDTADTDIDTNDTLTVQNAGSLVGTFGTAVVDADGDYTYTLGATPAQETELLAVDAGTDVTDTFALTITDSNGGSDTSDLVITIHGVTDVQPPVHLLTLPLRRSARPRLTLETHLLGLSQQEATPLMARQPLLELALRQPLPTRRTPITTATIVSLCKFPTER
jgi:VCBS repeat-containing protein